MKIIVHLTCTIFTVLILVFALLSPFDMAPVVTNTIAVQGFVISLSIALLMSFAEKIKNNFEIHSLFIDVLIKVLICYFVVFFEGAFFKMIQFSWKGFLEMTPALIPVFLVTYIIQYLTCVEWANSINQSINRKQ